MSILSSDLDILTKRYPTFFTEEILLSARSIIDTIEKDYYPNKILNIYPATIEGTILLFSAGIHGEDYMGISIRESGEVRFHLVCHNTNEYGSWPINANTLPKLLPGLKLISSIHRKKKRSLL
jgi:hypothetical protein